MKEYIVEQRREDGSIIYRINRARKTGVYKINKDSWQRDYVKEIQFRGFEQLPSGLYRDGRGFTKPGQRLLRRLHDVFGSRLRLTIAADSASTIVRYERSTRVIINHDQLRAFGSRFREIKRASNAELREALQEFVSSEFPGEFGETEHEFVGYAPGTLARVLGNPHVLDNLSMTDRRALQEFFPHFVKGMEFSLRSTTNIRFAQEGLGATVTVYLGKVVEEYERKLERSSTENTWQRFLQSHILLLLHSYSAVIEKQSVDLDGKYPDFMLIDPYGYLDIYEIKKPQTPMLKYDSSRGNYYWTPEVCKAISQVENYIDQTTHHRHDIAEKVRRKRGTQIKIVRPRGFIIAGVRTQIDNEDMEEDFRVLNDSLKNIDIIFYDDLLENIKALLSHFSENDVKKRANKSRKKTKKKTARK